MKSEKKIMTEIKDIVEEITSHVKEHEKYMEELKEKFPIKDFLRYTEFDLKEKIEMIPMKILEYQELLNKEESILNKFIEQKNKVIGEVYDHHRFEMDKKLDKYEIEKYYIPQDKKVLAFNKIIQKQKWKVEYFEACVKALDKMAWGIKDFIKTCTSI